MELLDEQAGKNGGRIKQGEVVGKRKKCRLERKEASKQEKK